MPRTKTKLPDLASELIRIAVTDLMKCEFDPKYKIDMAVWHEPNSHCSVCFAGSVMAKTFDLDFTMEASPDEDFSEEESNKLESLDKLRKGLIRSGLEAFCSFTWSSSAFDELPWAIDVEPYFEDPDVFKLQMLAIADELEECGL